MILRGSQVVPSSVNFQAPLSELVLFQSESTLMPSGQADRHSSLDMGIPYINHCEIPNPNKHAHTHTHTHTQLQTHMSLCAYLQRRPL